VPKEQADIIKIETCLELAGLIEKLDNLEHGADTTLIKEINPGGTELSGGEQQKLMLARAIYKDAPVLILDEPTAALDPIAESELYMKYNDLPAGQAGIAAGPARRAGAGRQVRHQFLFLTGSQAHDFVTGLY
jgi:ABC-type bacteriocin/lantibiotic exporter with double-glycine peptidase domain